MAAIFGEQGGIFHNPLVLILGVIVLTYIFLKFCSWARGFQLPGGFKKIIFILTAVALVGFNVLYTMGNAQIEATGSWSFANYALLGSFVWVFMFAFTLMAKTRK